jgi:hypothetical protein
MSATVVLSLFQAAPLIEARRAGAISALTSTDLGLTESKARLTPDGVDFANGETLGWESLEAIAASPHACFELAGGEIRKIQAFSELTGRVYSLYPTRGAPTMLVSGFPMHRIKQIDPWADTLAKVRPVLPRDSRRDARVLDTCTGLGYTALEAARFAREVVTIELDPTAQEIARRNPWSQPLFVHPAITQLIGDAAELIETFPDREFTQIVHDPPTMSLGGDLYSLTFYRATHRVLATGGRMFHYVGDPASVSGARVTRGVLFRLREAGFRRIQPRPEAFGVLACK